MNNNSASWAKLITSLKSDKYLGWKTLGGYVILFVVVTIAYALWAVGIRMLSLQLNTPAIIGHTLNRLGGIVIVIGVSAFAIRVILKRHWVDLMFRQHRGWAVDILFGIVLSVIAMAALFIIFRGNGWLIVQGWRWHTQSIFVWLDILWSSILINAYTAIGEEVIFRGYMLSGLKQAWGKGIGLAVTAVVFAGMHLFVSTAQQTSLALFILALVGPGLVLGWVYLRSGSLWLPIGLHFGWNLAQDDLFNLAGRQNLESIFGAQTQLQGPSWLVGTAFGIETGAMSLVALSIILVGAWLWTRKAVTP